MVKAIVLNILPKCTCVQTLAVRKFCYHCGYLIFFSATDWISRLRKPRIGFLSYMEEAFRISNLDLNSPLGILLLMAECHVHESFFPRTKLCEVVPVSAVGFYLPFNNLLLWIKHLGLMKSQMSVTNFLIWLNLLHQLSETIGMKGNAMVSLSMSS